MPRNSPGQPGAMVTERDEHRSWGVARVIAILVAAAALAGLGYLLYISASHARVDRQQTVVSALGRS